jgi:hypothetical protein
VKNDESTTLTSLRCNLSKLFPSACVLDPNSADGNSFLRVCHPTYSLNAASAKMRDECIVFCPHSSHSGTLRAGPAQVAGIYVDGRVDIGVEGRLGCTRLLLVKVPDTVGRVLVDLLADLSRLETCQHDSFQHRVERLTSFSKTGSFSTRLKNFRSHSLPCSFSVFRMARWRFSMMDFSAEVVSRSPLVIASATFFQAFRDSKSSCCSVGAMVRAVGFTAVWSKVSMTCKTRISKVRKQKGIDKIGTYLLRLRIFESELASPLALCSVDRLLLLVLGIDGGGEAVGLATDPAATAVFNLCSVSGRGLDVGGAVELDVGRSDDQAFDVQRRKRDEVVLVEGVDVVHGVADLLYVDGGLEGRFLRVVALEADAMAAVPDGVGRDGRVVAAHVSQARTPRAVHAAYLTCSLTRRVSPAASSHLPRNSSPKKGFSGFFSLPSFSLRLAYCCLSVLRNHFSTSNMRFAASFSAAGATKTEGCSVQYEENSTRDVVERMKAGAVMDDRSPLKDAMDCETVSPRPPSTVQAPPHALGSAPLGGASIP